RAGYLWEANQRNYPIIFANNAPEKVNEAIWQALNGNLTSAQTANESAPPMSITAPATPIKEVIEQKSTELAKETPKNADNIQYVTKNKRGVYSITEAGKEFLDEAVTSVDGDVYAFTDKLSPTTIAAAMARLSRRGDDMRITLLD